MQKYTSVIVSTQPVLGLDIARASFVAALRLDTTHWVRGTFPNHKGGFQALRTWLYQHFAGRVRAGLEATGIYGEAITHWLHAQGHTVHVLNPARVAAHARARGQRNKTDPADAVTIADYVATHALPAWAPPAPAHAALRDYCRLRQQLTAQRQQLKNQLHSAPALARDYLARLIQSFTTELAQLEAAIAAHLAAHPVLGEAVRRLTTVPAVGLRTATLCVAELPPITPESDPRALAAWCALTPRRQQSGQKEGRAYLGRGGNCHLRQALHMPALVAKRHNPLLKAFAIRLAQNGKSHGTLLGAVSHKLLRLMIGLLRHQQDFDPNWAPQKS